MINISKSGNAIKFAFTDSDHYLYGNGEIEVPVNSLSLIVDESNMVTFRKANSNDIFLSFDPANSNLSDKAGVIDFYKTNMVGSTGGGGGSESGITSGEVQTMIDNSLVDYYTDDEVDAALSGKASASDVAALQNEVAAKADTSAVTAVDNALSAYSAATDARIAEDEEVTAAALNNLDERIGDPYQKVSGLTIEADEEENFPFIRIEAELEDGNSNHTYINDAGVESTFENNTEGSHYSSYIAQGSIGNSATDSPDENVTSERSLEITTDGFRQTTDESYNDGESSYARYSSENEFNYSNGLTLSQSWYDPENDETTNSSLNIINNIDGETYIELTDVDENSVKIETTGITINGDAVVTESQLDDYQPILSAGTGIEISGNVISATGGGGATYSAGTNISIDTANTINCTIPAYFNSDARKGDIAIGTDINNVNSDYYRVVLGRSINASSVGSRYSIGIGTASNNSSEYSQLNGSNSVGIGKFFQITANQSVAIGSEAKSSVANGVAIGFQANATGTTKMNLNNQIKVDTNNQVYIKDKTNTTDVCIQDAIAALGGLKFVQCTQAEYDALVSGGTVDSSTIYFITNVVS